jgi:branched-chain amino acid transport system permease protein
MGKNKLPIKLTTAILLLGAVIFIALTPKMNSNYTLSVVNTALIYAIASFGLSIMLGMGGQLSFAAVAFMGGGAYFVANLTTGMHGFWVDSSLVLLITPLFFGVVAFLLGNILLKLRGTYFSFSTIALVQVSYSFFQNYRPIFGGPDGIPNVAPLKIFGYSFIDFKQWFYLLVIILAIVAFIVERIRTTKLGRSLASIRDNDTAALTLGVNVFKTKVIAFTIAGMLGALAGALYAQQGRFVASDMFTFERSTLFIIMAMMGGVNNTFGIIIGSLLVTMLPEWLRGLQGYLQLIYGISVIVLMVFMPMGLAGLGSSLTKIINRKMKARKEKTGRGVNV